MLKIRLARIGKKNQPQFHFVVTENRRPPKSNFIEILGTYHPKEKNKIQSLKLPRIKYWINQGAHLTERVAFLLKPYLIDAPKFIKEEIKKFEIKKEEKKKFFARKNEKEKS